MTDWAAASTLDRADLERRSSQWLAEQWQAETARLLAVGEDGRFATDEIGGRLLLGRAREWGAYDDQRHLLVGMRDFAPVFAVQATPDGPAYSLREVGHQLGDTELEIAATAAALTNWHRAEPFCPRCGEATRMIRGGYGRQCEPCGRELFPRTDPAVIVAVVDVDDRLLLARQRVWPPRRVSVLAGFVEAGESAERAIHREIAEESGVSVASVRFYGSQPWPYPRSLMLGYAARAATTAIAVDGDEIEEADWYDREAVTRGLADATLLLPNPSSIASRMIATWRAGRLDV